MHVPTPSGRPLHFNQPLCFPVRDGIRLVAGSVFSKKTGAATASRGSSWKKEVVCNRAQARGATETWSLGV